MKNSRSLSLLAFFGGALAVAFALIHAMKSASTIGIAPVIDDAFYSLSVSRHLALGHGLSVDGLQPTNGFQPLWVFLCSGLSWLLGGDRLATLRAALVLSTVVWIGFAIAMGRYARALARGQGMEGTTAGLCATLLSIGSYRVFRHFHNGLETGLAILLLTLALAQLFSLQHGRHWVLKTGLLFALLIYARLDSAVFVALYGATQLLLGLRERQFRWRPIVACALGGLALVLWLLRNLRLDGHVMPSSGRMEALFPNLHENVLATLKALVWWALPAGDLLPAWLRMHSMLNKVIFLCLGAVAIACFVLVCRKGRWRAMVFGESTLPLVLHLGFLVVFYTAFFAAPWFQERYLSPSVTLFIPLLALGMEGLADRYQRYVPAVLGLIVFANLAAMGLSARGSVATTNSLFTVQKTYAEKYVDPSCVLGAGQSGTLGYFRDRVVNLDGKVNRSALDAIVTDRLADYVAHESNVDVFVDWQVYAPPRVGKRGETFQLAQDMGKFQSWVRIGREHCVLGQATIRPDPYGGEILSRF